MKFNVIDFLEREKKEKTKKYGIENTAYSLEIFVFPMSYKDYLRIVHKFDIIARMTMSRGFADIQQPIVNRQK